MASIKRRPKASLAALADAGEQSIQKAKVNPNTTRNNRRHLALQADIPDLDPTDLLPADSTFVNSTNLNSTAEVPVNPLPSQTTEKVGYSTIRLPSGIESNCEIILIEDPSTCIVWKGNPRFGVNANVDSLRGSIKSSGTNVEPIKVRKNEQGVFEAITGSRRRQACIEALKPLTALYIHNLSDYNAQQLTVLENEDRDDPDAFRVAASYAALLKGENPACKDQVELASMLGLARPWVNQMLLVSRIPLPILDLISDEDKANFSKKKAIALAKDIKAIREAELEADLINRFNSAERATIAELIKIIDLMLDKPKPEQKTTFSVLETHNTHEILQKAGKKSLLLKKNIKNLSDEDIIRIIREGL
ncbi:ParB/RepB/Spo0J family partition protein [Algibacillus agarilyticus]|uniref:ParB/RepB/Spo0J family partition protein n=1 Tax=Algibacillus agarilyticus TaxID=2234133 RepID=UPI000DD07456|nr:ParB/RepB/Spo0J family partition protein [Algibacillus agarilyticus]